MQSTTKLAELLLERFKGRSDVVAVGNSDGSFAPHRFEIGQTMKPSWLIQHLDGTRCLGFYLMRGDDTVFCSCVDFDNKDKSPDDRWRDKAEQLYYELARMGLECVVEISQSGKAAHVWLFFSEAVEARLIRLFWKCVAENLEQTFPEVYPRQDHVREDGIGNLVRYPLWNQSRFVDIENDWEVVGVEAALSCRWVTAFELSELVARMGGELPEEGDSRVSSRVSRLIGREESLLGRRWRGDLEGLKDQSRSAAAQSIACELVRQYVPTNQVEDALRKWCEIHGYDKGDRDEWIRSTVDKAYDFVVSRREEKSRGVTTMLGACNSYLDQLERGQYKVIPSGVPEVDRSCDGVGLGEMCIIAARSGHGKTTFGAQWVHNAASRGIACLVISEEMSAEQLGKKALLWLSNVPEDEQGAKASELRSRAKEFYDSAAPIYVVESCFSVDRCEEVIDQFAQVHDVKLVAVDYMQLLKGQGQSRYEAVTDVSSRLKQAARRNDVALLAMCQLNREIEQRAKWEPMLSDLRESGQIEQDADLVLFLAWPCRFDTSQDEDTYLIWAAKRRNGAIRDRKMVVKFNASQQRIGMPDRVSVFDEWNHHGTT